MYLQPASFWCHEFFFWTFIEGVYEDLMYRCRFSRRELEDDILPPRSADDPTGAGAYTSAIWLAAAGALEGPDSRLGATRQEVLDFLRHRMDSDLADEIAWVAAVYDATAPHPPVSELLLGEQATTTP